MDHLTDEAETDPQDTENVLLDTETGLHHTVIGVLRETGHHEHLRYELAHLLECPVTGRCLDLTSPGLAPHDHDHPGPGVETPPCPTLHCSLR